MFRTARLPVYRDRAGQPPELTFSTAHVAAIANVSLRQLQWWDERNLVSPVQAGHRRYYSPDQVILIHVVAELHRRRLSLQRLRKLKRGILAVLDLAAKKFPADLYLVTDSRRVALCETLEQMKQFQLGITVVHLSPILSIVKAAQ